MWARRFICVVVLLSGVGVLAGMVLGPAGASAQTAAYFMEYKGSYSDNYSDTDNNADPPFTFTTHTTFSWDLKIYANATGQVTQSSLVAQGARTEAKPDQQEDCTFTQDTDPNLGGFSIGPGDDPGTATLVFGFPDVVDPGGQLTVSGSTDFDPSGCADEWAGTAVIGGGGLNAEDGSYSPDGCTEYEADPAFIPGHQVVDVSPDGYAQTYAGTQSLTVPSSCTQDGVNPISGTRTINATVTDKASSVTTPPPPPCSDASSTAHALPRAGTDQSCCKNIFYMDLWPTCKPVKPKKPDKKALKKKVTQLEKELDDAIAANEAIIAALHRNPKNVSLQELQEVAAQRTFGIQAQWFAAQDALENDPPDSHYAQIELPELWPGPPVRSVLCKRTKGRAACKRLGAALKAYVSADERTAEVWEALAVTANRWGSAYAAFSTDPNAPVGLELQTALSKAYYGELAQALAGEAKATTAVDKALHRAGLNHLSFTEQERREATALLKKSEPPAWLVKRMVSDGVVTSAAALRADWRVALKGAMVPASVDLTSLFPAGGSVPQIPGETYGSITIDDLYWISNAVPDTPGRDALTGYVTSAREATSATASRAALEQFLTYAKQHETGQLSVLLQTAVGPLLG